MAHPRIVALERKLAHVTEQTKRVELERELKALRLFYPEPEPEHEVPVERHAPEHVTAEEAKPAARRPGRPRKASPSGEGSPKNISGNGGLVLPSPNAKE